MSILILMIPKYSEKYSQGIYHLFLRVIPDSEDGAVITHGLITSPGFYFSV